MAANDKRLGIALASVHRVRRSAGALLGWMIRFKSCPRNQC